MSDSSRAKRSTYERALDMLEARARGADELRRLLLRKGEPPADVDAALERLTQLRSDRRRELRAPSGSLQSTRRRHVAPAHSAWSSPSAAWRARSPRPRSTRSSTRESVDEDQLIERAARKKLKTLGKLDDLTRQRRLYAFLARRGYDSDDIAKVLAVVLAE